MAKLPNPEVQKRNIRAAWAKLSDDDRLELAVELIGDEPNTPATTDPISTIRTAYADLDRNQRVKLLDDMFREITVTIDNSNPAAENVYAVFDNMREIALKLGIIEGK